MDASPSRQRVILHVDMDAFYASIEQRDRPELRGKPVIVGSESRRGVVSTASYEARPFGVGSAMPMVRALQLCPQAIVVPVRMSVYAEVSRQVMEVLDGFSPDVEPLSLDEAFLDMTGAEGLFGEPEAMGLKLKKAVFDRTQLTCSVGVAKNKFLAKLASDLRKPDGVTVIPFGEEAAFLAPLSVTKLWGVGPKTAARLERLGLRTIGDIASADPDWLVERLGKSQGRHLHALAHAHDERPVVSDRARKSVGAEVTLEHDIRGRHDVARLLRRQCQRVAEHLRREHLIAGGLRVKIRYSQGFRLKTRQAALPTPSDDSATLVAAASELMARFDLDAPIRLVGAAAFDLSPADSRDQLSLFGDAAGGGENNERRRELEHAVDDIRARFGDKIGFGD